MERALRLGGLDLAVVVLYLVGIVGLGLLAWRKRRARTGSSAEYFLAGGTLGWGIIGLALFSTNISTIHLVSLAQEGYVNGLAYGNFEWMAAFLLIVLSFFFAPFYIRSRVATLPDFLEKRYSRASRDWRWWGHVTLMRRGRRWQSRSVAPADGVDWCCIPVGRAGWTVSQPGPRLDRAARRWACWPTAWRRPCGRPIHGQPWLAAIWRC